MYNASLQHARYLNNLRIYIYQTWIPTKCHLFWLLVYFSLHQASPNTIPISITTINQFVADHVELDGKRHASVMTLPILFTINNYLCRITHSMSYAPLLQLSHPLLYRVISSWVLASIILDTFHDALSPGVQYNGHNLIILISMSLIFKWS